MSNDAVLVLFSGGQDSTTVLAWALNRFSRVETVGFIYGQKHAVELKQRPIIREGLRGMNHSWANRMGPDHIVKLDLIDQLAMSVQPVDWSPQRPSFGKRYIPGRNLIMLSMSASVAFRRDIATL